MSIQLINEYFSNPKELESTLMLNFLFFIILKNVKIN